MDSTLKREKSTDSALKREISSDSRRRRMRSFPPKVVIILDGGGSRSLFQLEILKRIEDELFNRTGKKLWEVTSMVAGSSSGAVVAAFLALNHNSIGEIKQVFEGSLPSIYSVPKSRFWSYWGYARYDATPLEAIFQKNFSDGTLLPKKGDASYLQRDPQLVVFAADATEKQVCFRNYVPKILDLDFQASKEIKIREALRATTASPKLFDVAEFQLSGKTCTFTDPTIRSNNPIMEAYTEAQREFGEDCVDIIISVGTGRNSWGERERTSWFSQVPAPVPGYHVHEQFREKLLLDYKEPEDRPEYFRFDPLEVGHIAADCVNHEQLRNGYSAMQKYLSDPCVSNLINQCVYLF